MERIEPANVTLKMRLEKNGRGGKTVTVLFDLPNNDAYFTDLTQKLKNTLGTGGTFKNRRIEIQGDHKTRIQKYLENLGFKIKLAGA
jgi:translation initiation factor 1